MENQSQVAPWLETLPKQPSYSTATGELQADVVVIGGGIVGIMTAYELAQRNVAVMLLEQNQLISGSTGSTTAFLSRVPDAWLPDLVKKHGIQFCKKLLQANRSAQHHLFEIIKQNKLDCDFSECSSYMYAYKLNEERLQSLWQVYRRVDDQAEFIKGDDVKKTGAPIAEAIQVKHEGQFNIRKFVFGLLQQSIFKKVKLYEQSQVVEIITIGDGVAIKTAQATIHAKQVIVTSGLPQPHFPELAKLFQHKLTYVLTAQYENIAPITQNLFWDVGNPYFYYRRMDDHTIMLGGADQPADAATNQQPFSTLRNFLATHWPQAQPVITHEWSGSIYLTQDELPYVDYAPNSNHKVLIASGFAGNGMVMGVLAARLLADRVMRKANPVATLFSFARNAKNKHTQFFTSLAVVVYLVILVLPALIFFQTRGGLAFLSGTNFTMASQLVFPLAGLYAFTLVWFQMMLGTNLDWLRKIWPNIMVWHKVQGVVAFSFALTHPLLILLGFGVVTFMQFEFVLPNLVPFAWLGLAQLSVLVITVGVALGRKLPWLKQYWLYIHYGNYGVFWFIWIHSWYIGTDTKLEPLHTVWIVVALVVAVSMLRRIIHNVKLVQVPVGLATSAVKFRRVAAVTDFQPGKSLCVTANGVQLALFNIKGKYYAINNLCTHAGGPLCNGKVEGNKVECPWHGSKFDITTGKVVLSPAVQPIKTYRVRVVGDEIQVEC